MKTDFFAMDTYMTLDIEGTQNNCDDVKKEIYRLDNLMKKDKINMSDNEICKIVSFSNQISEITDGAFDITIAPLCELWGFWNGNFRVPSKEEIRECIKYTGYQKIKIDERGVTLPDKSAIDLGGVGKGYAGDRAAEILKSSGVTSAILSLGGNVQAIGLKDDKESWKVGIRSPESDTDYVGYVSVSDKAVITSGGYQRFFEKDGTTYEHIIDPKTGYPVKSDLSSVTIISESGLLADALSTALYVTGYDKAIQFCKSNNYKINGTEFAAVFIKRDNTVSVFGNVEFAKK